MLTLLHTSDWHLGRRLYGKPRYSEFEQFLDWQLQVIREQAVDVLLIAGDIFDTTTPSNQAQNLYYDFLSQISQTGCRHVVIVAGNHDSPSFLDAPKQLLKSFNIHIIGSISDNLTDEVITLLDKSGNPELIIMAVPYLRDRDVRMVASGEGLDDKERKLAQGIAAHYQTITEIALQRQADIHSKYARKVPIVATGHLFTVGGQTAEGDGVRDLYVGSLGSIGVEIFHPQIDYVALGHLHIPQTVGGQARIRYSGSPLAMGFGESGQQKQLHLLRFEPTQALLDQALQPLVVQKAQTISSPQPKKPNNISSSLDLFADISQADDSPIDKDFTNQLPSSVASPNQPYNIAQLSDTALLQSLAVPVFQRLQTIKGDWQTISSSLKHLKNSGQSVWLEIVYDGQAVVGDLSEKINELIKDSLLEVLRTKNFHQRERIIQAQRLDETLEELNEMQVFERCLQAHNVIDEQKPMLWAKYAEVLESLKEAEK